MANNVSTPWKIQRIGRFREFEKLTRFRKLGEMEV